MKRFILSSSVLLFSSIVFAQSQVVFPNKTMTAKPTGAKYNASFSVSNASPTVAGKVIVKNGLGEDLKERNCSGLKLIPKALCVLENVETALKLALFYPKSFEVVLNNQTVAAHGQYPRNKGMIEIPVTLKAQNAMKVIVKGIVTNFIELKVTAQTQTPNLPPVADFTFSPTMGYAPLLVNFSALTSSDRDGTIAQYNWDFGDGQTASGVIVTHTFTTHGQFAVKLTVVDNRGASHSKTMSINVYQSLPPIANLTLRSPASGDAPLMALFDSTGTSDPRGFALTYEWNFGDGNTSNESGLVTHTFENAGSYIVQLKVTNTQGLSDTKSVVVTANQVVLPPDPAEIAPQISQFDPTTFEEKFSFLYEGTNPVQRNVVPGVIDPERVAILRGQILDEDENPISGARVTVLGSGEFGYTLSRVDGYFDIALNGGGIETLMFEKTGYLPVQRTYNTKFKDFSGTDSIMLTTLDQRVTVIKSNSPEVQVVKGSTMSDNDGERTATLILPKETTAQVELPNGTLVSLPTLSMRVTEFTVGENGPKKMPASLPSYTNYTYAVDVTADEALALGAKHIKFSKPVSYYVDNFLGFKAGVNVPVGVYDYDRGLWIPKPDGRIIAILDIQNNKAVLDVKGEGQPASAAQLLDLGIDEDELTQLASVYQIGSSIWRARLDRFSPLDLNFFSGTTNLPPAAPPIFPQTGPCSCPTKMSGWSVIDVSSQSLKEELDVIGTPFKLVYESQRHRPDVFIPIQLTSLNPNNSIQRIDLSIDIAGTKFKKSFNPSRDLIHNFTWDMKDAYGRQVSTPTLMKIRITYAYPAEYFASILSGVTSFATFPTDMIAMLVEARDFGTLSSEYSILIDPIKTPTTEIGGWSLDIHHQYDPETSTIYYGDGGRKVSSQISGTDDLVSSVIAGTGVAGYNGDNIPAKEAQLGYPVSTYITSDGSIFIYENGNHRIRKVRTDGVIQTFAGNGTPGYSGDGGPATEASIANAGVLSMTEGADGDIYIGDWGNYAIRKIDKFGIITTIAGDGTPGFAGDGGPARFARFHNIEQVVYKDGSLYIADSQNSRIRVISPDGNIRTILGDGVPGISPDGTPAANARVSYPLGLAFSKDGELYYSDVGYDVIQKITRNGTIETVAGTAGIENFSGDGDLAKNALLKNPTWLVVRDDNSILFNDKGNRRIRKIENGNIRTIIGSGILGAARVPDFALNTSFNDQRNFAVAQNGDVIIAETGSSRVIRFSSQKHIHSENAGNLWVASEDGSEIFEFNKLGRHLRTLNAITGATKWHFNYESGRLVSVSDFFGNLTEFERLGDRIQRIVAPYGQTTDFAYDSRNFLSEFLQPNGSRYSMTYTPAGQLTSFTKPTSARSSFKYHPDGRLQTDTNAVGDSYSLAQIWNIPTNTKVTGTSPEGLVNVVEFSSGGGTTVTSKDLPSGLYVRNISVGNISQTSTTADTLTHKEFTIDPRLQTNAVFPSAFQERRGSIWRSSFTARIYSNFSLNNLFNFDFTDRTTTNTHSVSTLNYSSANRTYTYSSALNRHQQVQINFAGQPIYQRVGTLAPLQTHYDTKGRPIAISQDGRVTTLKYGLHGEVSELTDAENRTTFFEYDANLKNTKIITPDGREIEKRYDENGNVSEIVPSGRSSHEFGRNLLDLLTSYLPPSISGITAVTTYEYNKDKQLTSIVRPDGQEISNIYSPSTGKLMEIRTSRGSYFYTYANDGQPTSVISPDGIGSSYGYSGSLLTSETNTGSTPSQLGISYNSFFNPSSISLNGVPISIAYDNDQFPKNIGQLELTYNSDGLLSEIVLNAIHESYTYNQFGEIMSLAVAGAPYAYFFTRDKLGRIVEKTETIDSRTTSYRYQYDLAGRLSQVFTNGNLTKHYRYDSNGNRTNLSTPDKSISATYDAQDRLTSYGNLLYEYNLNGETISVTNQTTSEVMGFAYDPFGNLKIVEKPGKNIEYLIDGQHRRVGKKVNGMLVRYFSYQSQLQIAGEFDGLGNITSRFIYGTKSNVPDYMIKNNISYKILSDSLGSVNLVVNAATGEIAQKITYDEFGNVIEDTNPEFQPFGFAGGLYDRDTGLVRFGYRDYDPVVGRWTKKDPLLFGGDALNLFEYVGNDPVNSIDPTGLKTDVVCRPLAGGAGLTGAKHCYLRITPESGSSLGTEPIYLSLFSHEGKGYKLINADADVGSGGDSFEVNNLQCRVSIDETDKAILNSYRRQPIESNYNAVSDNSNTFVRRVLEGAGIKNVPSLPWTAIGY